MINYSLHNVKEIPFEYIDDYFGEFQNNGEFCNVLWRLHEVNINEWLKEIEYDPTTVYVGFCVNGSLVGVGRITPNPRHLANGRIGYAIRPSERGKLYAPTMIRLMEDYCKLLNVNEITACVEETNAKSLKALDKAGFAPTGIKYAWNGGRTAIELHPKKTL